MFFLGLILQKILKLYKISKKHIIYIIYIRDEEEDKKMKKKIIIALVMMMALLSLTACEHLTEDKGNIPMETVPAHVDDGVYVYVDPETGVNYLIYNRGADNCSMSVRYNSDGYIMITK